MSAPRSTFAQRWREYGDRPPIARWTARISSVLGLLIGAALALLALAVVAKLVVLLVFWVAS